MRYNVDQEQSSRVAETAYQLLQQVGPAWELDSGLAKNMMDWASRLHEIGLDISHAGFQRHGAYIAQNADLPGFPRSEQILLAWMIASQRSGFDKSQFRVLPNEWRERALRLSILFRLAVLLNRSRGPSSPSGIGASIEESTLKLNFPPRWLEANPLTVADLDREQQYMHAVSYDLQYG
jgi:exopolyphosphatase/guanosine-5'-triphosphate,3'-diphosphate pyrophosphatase